MRERNFKLNLFYPLFIALCISPWVALGCGGATDTPATEEADAAVPDVQEDAALLGAPIAVSELGASSFVLLGIGSDSALLVRAGTTREMWVVRAQGFGAYLFATQFVWSWQGSAIAPDASTCSWRDGDGVASGPGFASGVVTLDGLTTEPPEATTGTLIALASKLRTQMVAGDALDAGTFFVSVDLSATAHAHGVAQCTLGQWGTEESEDTYDAVVFVGTEAEVESWWGALAALMPDE